MTDNPPPLGEVPYLPPTHVCEDHEGSRFTGSPCRNCVPISTNLMRHRYEVLMEAARFLDAYVDGDEYWTAMAPGEVLRYHAAKTTPARFTREAI